MPVLGKMCESNDIIIRQETMLCSHNRDMIHTIHPDFYAGGCSSGNSEELILTGRPHGGLVVLWRKTIGCVKTKKYSDRIYGIELMGSDKLVILNVYLPYDNNSFESLDNFRQILGETSAIIQDSNTNEVIVMGDFNADFKCRFGEELMYVTADNALQISDGILRGYRYDCFTNISEAHGTVPWLGHVVCTGTAHRHVLSCDTLDDITLGDHIPVQIVYYFKQGDHVKTSHSNDEVEDGIPHVKWSSASDAEILEYKKITNLLLGLIDINKDAFTCCELNCNNVDHQHEIDSVAEWLRAWDALTMFEATVCGRS